MISIAYGGGSGNDIKGQQLHLVELHIDRAYVNSPVVDEVIAACGTVFAKPWGQRSHRPGRFSKHDFKIDLRSRTITCPAGEVEPYSTCVARQRFRISRAFNECFTKLPKQ